MEQENTWKRPDFEDYLKEFALFRKAAKGILGEGYGEETIRSLFASWRIDCREGRGASINVPNGNGNGHAPAPQQPPPPAPGSILAETKRMNGNAPAPTPAPPQGGPGPAYKPSNGFRKDAPPAVRFAYALARDLARQHNTTLNHVMSDYCQGKGTFDDCTREQLSAIIDAMKKALGRQ